MLNFGLNRWLSSEREEAYSDWVSRTLQEVGRRRTEWLLLGVDSSLTDDHCETSREVWVPEGHNGHAGRLDCVVYCSDTVIVLELKTGDAAAADTAKQEGYANWLKARQEPRKVAVLLATDVNDTDEFGFQPLPWRVFCKRLRKLLPELVREDRLLLACVIGAFLGAIEQNILGFPAISLRSRWIALHGRCYRRADGLDRPAHWVRIKVRIAMRRGGLRMPLSDDWQAERCPCPVGRKGMAQIVHA